MMGALSAHWLQDRNHSAPAIYSAQRNPLRFRTPDVFGPHYTSLAKSLFAIKSPVFNKTNQASFTLQMS